MVSEYVLKFKKNHGSEETLFYDDYERALTSFGYFYLVSNISCSEYQQVFLLDGDQFLSFAVLRMLPISSDGQTTVHDYSNRKSSS